jgi:AcrR family transcriptional regulator
LYYCLIDQFTSEPGMSLPQLKRRDVQAAPVAPRRTAKARPQRRAKADRGAETRAQLIAAALEVFGRLGYEGASTRAIARAAGANLAAIVYHFGSKEALHLAVAEHVADAISKRMMPHVAAIAAMAGQPTPEAARAGLTRLIDAFIDTILGSADAELWARFVVREQMQPTAAFDVIYRILGGAADLATRLVASATGATDAPETRLKVFTIMGQVLVFRVAQTLVFRRMGWRTIGEKQRAEIKRVVQANVAAILAGGVS